MIILAPPLKFIPTAQVSGGIFLHGGYTKENRDFMHKALEVKPSGLPPQAPILNCLYHLSWFYLLTVSEITYLAKSYSVSGLTPLPHIPNQLHFIQESTHEVPEANWEARVMPVLI